MLRSAIAFGALLVAAAPASVQFHGGFAERRGFGFSVRGPGFRFSAYSRTFYAAPAFGYGWVPAFGPGYGPGFGNPFFLPPPPIVVGPPFIVPVGNNEPVHPEADVVRGEFRVISPRKKDEGAIAPFVDRVAVPEKPRVDPFLEPRAIGLTEPAADPARQMKLAREALASGEFGTAAEQLDRVLRATPEDATTLFLKSQAQFAAGQYVEAVATIRTGIKTHPAWATLDVKPQDLFGKPARFDGLLGDLKRSLGANPDSTALQFLHAHQLWFAGDRVDAKVMFERLANRLKDVDSVDPFLKK